ASEREFANRRGDLVRSPRDWDTHIARLGRVVRGRLDDDPHRTADAGGIPTGDFARLVEQTQVRIKGIGQARLRRVAAPDVSVLRSKPHRACTMRLHDYRIIACS